MCQLLVNLTGRLITDGFRQACFHLARHRCLAEDHEFALRIFH
jgi:hypothetical protein